MGLLRVLFMLPVPIFAVIAFTCWNSHIVLFSCILFDIFLFPCLTINPVPISLIVFFNTMFLLEFFVPPFSLEPFSSTLHNFKEEMHTLLSESQLDLDLISSHRKMTSMTIIEWVGIEPCLHFI